MLPADAPMVEVEDMLAVVQQAAPEGALALAGFSFGGFVTSQVFARLQPARAIDKLVLVAPAASRFAVAPVAEAARHDRDTKRHLGSRRPRGPRGRTPESSRSCGAQAAFGGRRRALDRLFDGNVG